MAYNRKNILQRMIDVQEIYCANSQKHRGGSTDKWIFEQIISPSYRISRATFYEYLGTNAKKELKGLLAEAEKQFSLFS